jgi:hypothetical protein
VLANRTTLMKDIFTVECRHALSNMLESSKQDSEDSSKVTSKILIYYYYYCSIYVVEARFLQAFIYKK